MTDRRQWVAALKAAPLPASLRPMRATLLVVADLMTPDGELYRWHGEMLDATGLPARSLERHLQHAVAAGWLVRETRGGNGRRSLYLATIPDQSCAPHVADNSGPEDGSCAPSAADNSESCPPSTRVPLAKVVRHYVAESIKTGRERSELQALDRHRDRRNDHHEARGPRPDVGRMTGSRYDGVPATQLPPSADGLTAQVVPESGTALRESAREPGTCALCRLPLPRGLVLLGRTRHLEGCPA